jgi:DNA-binding MarR family transcriptional regulator
MGPELTFHQYQSLLIIDDLKECTLRELSSRLHTAPSTTSQLVDRLVRAELITRTSHTGDRRKILLTLTDEGRDVMRRRTSDVRRNYARLLSTLSESEQAEFEDAFVTIYRVASKVEARMKEIQMTHAETDED